MLLKLRKITSETVTTAALPWRNTTNFMKQLKHKKAKEHPKVLPLFMAFQKQPTRAQQMSETTVEEDRHVIF